MDTALTALTVQGVLTNSYPVRQKLASIKQGLPGIDWYPHDSLGNLDQFQSLLNGFDFPTATVLDIGAADGDISFLFASLGARVHAIDFEDANYNQCTALRAVNEALGQVVKFENRSVDEGLPLEATYDLCVMTGVAYHLRNPMQVYQTLARHCRRLITNTRVIDELDGHNVSDIPAAYLLAPDESNDDPSNFWLPTPAGYRRMLARSGWRIEATHCVGAEIGRVDDQHDKRMYLLCAPIENIKERWVYSY